MAENTRKDDARLKQQIQDLQTEVSRLRTENRRWAKLGHIDGANFILILYPGELETVRGRANMVRARVRTHEFPCADSVAQIAVSAGIHSVQPSEGADFRSLGEEYVSKLNQALYAAKKAGGNRVEVV